MEKISKIFTAFFENTESFKEKIYPLAKRSGLSNEEALCLITIYKFPEMQLFCTEICSSLLDLGFIEISNVGYKTTGKGAILAKSLWLGFDK